MYNIYVKLTIDNTTRAGKGKVKCTPVQALRLCTGRTALRGRRGEPFHDHGTIRGWWVSVKPRPLFTPRKTRYRLHRRLGGPQGRSGQVRKISTPPGFLFFTLFSRNSCAGGSQTVIIHGLWGVFLSVVLGSIWWCSRKDTLVRTGFPPSGVLLLRSSEYTQISARVRAPSRPMMCFPTSPLKKIHEVPCERRWWVCRRQ